MIDCRVFALPLALALIAAAPASDLEPGFRDLLSGDLRFTSAEMADLEKGKVVTHGLGAVAAGEVAAVGAVRVKTRKEIFVDSYRDIEHFKQGAEVLQIGRFSNPPRMDDLAPLTLDAEDVDVRNCRVGDCDIRLPAATIVRFQREINWKADDPQLRAAALFKQVLLDDAQAYLSGGPGRIVEYNDEKRPIRPADDFVGLLKNSPFTDRLVPGLADHLRDFPAARLPGAEDFLYWSKEKFGLTPFVTMTHVTIAPANATRVVLASKDVYSSRYFDASLTVTIASDAASSADAFYLVYVNRSRANALKGLMAGLRRSIVERRARASLDENLKAVRRRLESRD